MPQLDVFTFSTTVFYTSLLFIILHFSLHVVYLPAIGKALKVRYLIGKKIKKEVLEGTFRIHGGEEEFRNLKVAVKKINNVDAGGSCSPADLLLDIKNYN